MPSGRVWGLTRTSTACATGRTAKARPASERAPVSEEARPRAALVAVQLPDADDTAFASSVAELGRLARTLGLDVDADRKGLRQRYSELVRRYHPDRNGGDRSHEKALQQVIEAYTALRSRPAFA